MSSKTGSVDISAVQSTASTIDSLNNELESILMATKTKVDGLLSSWAGNCRFRHGGSVQFLCS